MNPIAGLSIPVLICYTLLSVGCTSADSSFDSVVEKEDVATQIIIGGKFLYSEKGELRNVLEAGKLERTDDSDIWEVSDGFKLFIDGNNEDYKAILSGGRGVYYSKKSYLIARDGVQLVNIEGEKLNTEYLVWSHDSDKVYTDRPVRIETSTGILHGKGLESDSKFENYKILDPTGSFDLP
ncbi:MAG TPA: LPS export ABC transporter periplasmic protein LptC [Flavobacteriales bacterium]|nr:LPS export ABC transporter periplasmic protein LptC [Flavobacteriales bacterium]HIO58669.1 LPS export ABC transporter periplasmic protein LptC [Flavobacteriales bacterium]